MIRISIEKAVERARDVQPPDNDIISLSMLPDGQWIAVYVKNESVVKGFERTCYSLLECPLFDYDEFS